MSKRHREENVWNAERGICFDGKTRGPVCFLETPAVQFSYGNSQMSNQRVEWTEVERTPGPVDGKLRLAHPGMSERAVSERDDI